MSTQYFRLDSVPMPTYLTKTQSRGSKSKNLLLQQIFTVFSCTFVNYISQQLKIHRNEFH